jgi:hypothetical protein
MRVLCSIVVAVLGSSCGKPADPVNDGGTCVATFSGAVTGTVSSCEVTMSYSASSNTTLVATSGASVGAYDWAGFSFTLDGRPDAGAFDQQFMRTAADSIGDSSSSSSPFWVAEHDQNNNLGSSILRLTSLGAATDLGGGTTQYDLPHGTVTANLADQNPSSSMPAVMLNVTF